MPHDENAVRLAKLADERLAGLSIPTADRPAARRTMIAAIQREEAAAADAAAAASAAQAALVEHQAERSRIAAVVRAGRDTGRPRQALRLALAGPVTAAQARAILAGLPLDADAKPEHLALPVPGTFGPPGAVAERKRLASIFAHPASAERFTAACALALEGDAPAEAVAALLAGLPPEAKTLTGAALIAARAEGLAEFGAGGGEAPAPSRAEASRSGWAKAVAAANRQIGAAPATSSGAAPMPAMPAAGPGAPGAVL